MNRCCQRVSHLLDRVYGRVLWVYPAEFRDEYGAEMARFFREDCRRTARRSGLAGLLFQGLRTLADLLSTAPGAHMEISRQDLGFALRMLKNGPAFSLAAIVALALGIGANSAIFSLVHGILIAPLPFPEPDRLVMVWEKNPRGIDRNSVSPPNFADFQAGSKSLSAVAAYYEDSVNLTGAGEPEHVLSAEVTSGFFEVLGVHPVVGASWRPAQDESQVILSHGLWRRRFNEDPDIAGKVLRLDDKSYTIAGVLPKSFRFSSPQVALWTTMPAGYFRLSRQAHFLSTVARLKPGISIQQARTELEAVAAGLARQYPASNRGWGVTIVPLKEQIVGDIRRPLLVLLGSVGLVLLIVCANIANLLLARGTRRRGEIAIRTALGASAGRIGRQMLTESMLLAFIGGAAGLLLAWGFLEAFGGLGTKAVPRLEEVGLNGWAIAFTSAIALLAGAVSGAVPALTASRTDLNGALKEGTANRKSFVSHRLRGALLHSEVALSLLLLTGAGLLIRSFLHLQRLDPGFEADRVTTFQIDMPQSRYSDSAKRAALLQEALARLGALPGVDTAGMISNLPLTGGEGYNRFGFTIEGRENAATAEDHRFYARWITPGYFGSMSIPLVRGRDFSERDRAGSAPAVIVDEALARRYFPNENPVGKFLRVSYAKSTPREIVGVAGEVRVVALDREPAPQIYIPVFQEPQWPTMSVAIRGSIARPVAAEALRRELHRIDGNLPVYDVQPMAGRVAESIAPRRLNMLLMSVLAAIALLLASIGIYGVVSYVVGERLHEIAIRMALGARPKEILLLVVGQGMRYALVGMAGGLVASLLLTKAVAGLIFGISPLDPWTLGAVVLVTAGVALSACAVPAYRASRVHPASALRWHSADRGL